MGTPHMMTFATLAQLTSTSGSLERLNMPAELKSIFKQCQVGHKAGRTFGFDFRNDGCEFVAMNCILHSRCETLDTSHGRYLRNAGGSGNPIQIRTGGS